MSPENDQTKWRGIRPTNPPEAIPVTESTPLTDVLVAPSAGDPEFHTLTKKRAPAIADLQAPTSIVNVAVNLVVVGGSEFHNLYTVPGGKLLVVNHVTGAYSTARPNNVYFYIKVGAVYYYFLTEPYGAGWEWHTTRVHFPADETYIVGCRFEPVANGESSTLRLFGYLVDKYV